MICWASNHISLPMSPTPKLFLARYQLLKLRRNFFHPSADKSFNLLRRARPEREIAGTLQTLEDISKRCDSCQRIQIASTRFGVAFGAKHVRFIESILLDFMYIDGKPVIHIFNEGKRFKAARLLPNVSTETIWRTLLEMWVMIHSGIPNSMLVDQGSAFGGLFVD